jgi:hypothetical protein
LEPLPVLESHKWRAWEVGVVVIAVLALVVTFVGIVVYHTKSRGFSSLNDDDDNHNQRYGKRHRHASMNAMEASLFGDAIPLTTTEPIHISDPVDMLLLDESGGSQPRRLDFVVGTPTTRSHLPSFSDTLGRNRPYRS